MAIVKLELNDHGSHSFSIFDEDGKAGEMIFDLKDHTITVYHTEIFASKEGHGYAEMLLGALVDYARSHSFKIIPLCVYVHQKFVDNPKKFQDVWDKTSPE